jgi:hypothetical protein
MVRTSEQFTAPTTMAAIVGGFVRIPVGQLLAAWFACQGLDLGIGHFRAYLACHEMLKRRAFAAKHVQPAFGFAELAGLLGVTLERARLLNYQLVDAGLLACTESSITFPDQPPIPDDLFAPFANSIGRGSGMLTVPRRLLRFLVKGASAATIAVALGGLFRCASCRHGQPNSWGRFKASWIATAFRVGLRQVKDARKQLVDLGWLIIDVEGNNRQSAMNRWGRAYRINLDWSPTAARSAPPPPAPAAPSAPPLPDRNPPREEFKDQNPASGGPAGVQLSQGEGGTVIPEIANPPAATPPVTPPSPAPVVLASPVPVVLASPAPAQSPTPATTPTSPTTGSPAVSPPERPAATPRPSPVVPDPVPAPGGLPAPRLDDVRVEDLKDTGRLMDLLGQAVARGMVSGSEADRLRLVGAAEHALAIGQGNPAGLFVYLIRGKLWRYLTQDDEDRANVRIKAFLRGPERPRVAAMGLPRPSGPSLSEDAKVVREIRAAFIRAGIFRDPFPEFHRRNPEWSRERWDAAMAELEGAR